MGAVYRLDELLVEEVSIVDRPANKRRFLTIKSEGAMGQQVNVDDQGNLVTDAAPEATPAAPAVPDDVSVVDLGESFAQAGATLTGIQKKLTIPSEMRADIFRAIGDSVRRLHTVMNAADVAQTDEKDGSTLVPVLMQELRDVSVSLNAAVKRLGGVAKSDDKGTVVVETDTPDDLEHALTTAVEAVETAVQKRRMGKGRLGKFKTALSTLQGILAELEGPAQPAKGGGDETAAATTATTAKVGKSEDVVTVSKADFERVTGYVERLASMVQTQGKELRELRAARPQSNAIPVDKSEPTAGGDVYWPLDMNSEKDKKSVHKSVSFHE